MIGMDLKIRKGYKVYKKLEKSLYEWLSKQHAYGEICECNTPERITLRDKDESVCVDLCAFCGGEVTE